MSDTKLKPCPFCGGEVEILTEEVDATREVYNFHCDNCDMSTYYDYSDKEEAIKHWNTRKPIDRIVEQLEEYAKSRICWRYEDCPYRDNEKIYCENCGALGALDIVKVGGIDG